MDLDYVSYNNGAYGGPSKMRVTVEAVCNARECRFQLFLDYNLKWERRLFTITRPLRLAMAGRSLACR